MFQRITRRLIATAIACFLGAGTALAASAGFQSMDVATQGNWKGAYGQDGYIIANDSNNPPAYAVVSSTGALAYTWWSSSSDVRALLKSGSTTDRIASTYYTNGAMTFDVNLTDGQAHQIALYCLDLDTSSRSETISILDAGTNAVLDTRPLANFHGGVYAIWNIQGHVLIRASLTGGLNAVVSGIFFRTPGGGTPPPTVSITNPTGGTVSGVVPVTATATASSPATLVSVQFAVDGVSLGGPVTGTGPSFSTSWTTTASLNASHTLTAVATDSLGQTATSTAVTVTVSNTGGTLPPAATFAGTDSTTQGNWKSTYGKDGYAIPSDSSVLPAYVTLKSSGATSWTWAPSSTDVRALLKGASTGDRIASAYYSDTTFQFDFNFTDGQPHLLAIYFLDMETNDRVESVTVLNADTNAVLDQRTVSTFHNGMYLMWNAQGHIAVQVTHTSGLSAVLSGIFFGGGTISGGPPTVSLTSPAAGATVQNSVALTATAAANGATMSSVQFLLDGAALGSPVAGTGPTYTMNWNTGTVANGLHTLAAAATDSLARQTTSSTISVTVANTVTPTVSVTSPAAGSTVHNSVTLAATATATAAGANMSSLQFLVDGANAGTAIAGAGPNYSMQWDSTTVSNGSHTISAIATDTQAHQGTSAGATVTVANGNPPAVSITSPAAGGVVQGNAVTVTATATANLANMVSVQFQMDGASLGGPVAGGGPTYTVTWNTTTASNGSHSLVAIATDSLNRQTTSAPVQVTVSNSTGAGAPSATFVKADTATQGNWKGVYGQDGAIIANDGNTPPVYAAATFSGAATYTWVSSTTDGRALMKSSAAGDRIASTYYSGGSFTIDLNLATSSAIQVALYCVDWDTTTRTQSIAILDSRNNAVLDLQQVANFHSGAYYVWNLTGHVIIQVTNTSSLNGVVSGVFFRALTALTPPTVSITSPAAGSALAGPVTLTASATSAQGMAGVQYQLDGVNLGQPVTAAPYTMRWASPTAADGPHTLTAIASDVLGITAASSPVAVTITNGPPPTPTAAFVGSDATTSGSWVGTYGQDGFIIANDITNPPFYATVGFNGAQTFTWHAADPTTDLPGLQKSPTNTQRIGAAFLQPFYPNSSSNTPLLMDVNFVDNLTHQFAMYFVDWHHPIRTQVIDVLDPNTMVVLDTQTISAFYNGIYLIWNLRGHVRFRIYVTSWPGYPDPTAAPDSVVASGLFFNSTVVTPTVPPPTVSITAPTLNQSISGTFTLSATAQSQASIGTVQFQLDGVNLGPAITGAGPTYSYQWNTQTTGNGPHLLTAVATDSPFHQRTTSSTLQFLVGNPLPSVSAAFIGTDLTTRGSWKGVYGQDGYIIPGDSNNPPPYAVVNFPGAAQLTWSITADVRALQEASSPSNRIASVYYGSPNFSIDLNLSDGLPHRLALYLLDWDGSGRAQTITVADANTLQTLDSRTVSSFGGGQYLVWSAQGHILIQFARTAGPNAVVSGVFLEP